MKITNALVFDPKEGFVARDFCVKDGLIAEDALGPISAHGCYVIPGLTDLHFHGCVGEDFSDATPDGLQKMADYELSRGITQICPAGMTLGEDQLTKICQNAAAHREKNSGGAELVGLHLEGPFLSMAKKGAQNAAYIHDPDPAMLHRLQEAAGGLVKLVTLAPEQPGSLEFIQSARQDGVTVSLGHTTADYDTASAAYKAGARQATHLFNAMPPFTHRSPGVVGAAFDYPEVKVELICDGVHIHPAVVRAVFKLFGSDRVILISDSLRATGMPDGRYPFGGQEIEVHGNRATMADDPNTLAGSVSDLMACLKTAVSFGIPLADAVTAAAVNPAKVLGIYNRLGSLDIGKEANAAILDEHLDLKAVIYHGEVVSGAL
ncbi:N-acetylglucosamine-6-phosphate deacetylase [Lawsonibacter sp. LCP25S3_G6]|uniref:N-acetylglucosamine-6-phosphate deacetylase n=1 Tax=unclassified Lawsonibacter TaxID=2617946 RepID=UPI003F96BB05